MIISGQIVSGPRQLISESGERINGRLKPKKFFLGVSPCAFAAKRVWVDSVLTDAQRLLFLKNNFSDIQFYSIDYETIDHDSGRELIHAYALYQRISGRNITAVETSLHGLGRAVTQLFNCKKSFQCIEIYSEHIILSVHHKSRIYYFIRESFTGAHQVLYAVRRALEHYYASKPVEIEHCFYINFTGSEKLNIYTSIDFDAPYTVIDPDWIEWLIPYGLACRGLTHD